MDDSSGLPGPSPYKNVRTLYAMHFMFAAISRMWQFGVVLFMALLTNNSLSFVALAGLSSSGLILVASPSIGKWIDATDRLVSVRTAIIGKALNVFLGYLVCGILVVQKKDPDVPITSPWIYLLPLFCALAQVCFASIPLCIEKDWIVVLSDGDSQWLSRTNSVMKQIDLFCKALAPALTGAIFSGFMPMQVAVILLITNTFAAALMYYFLQDVYVSWPQLHRRKKPISLETITSEIESSISESEEEDKINKFFNKKSESTLENADGANFCGGFFHSGVAMPMLAYSFLYLTVLSFGSIMIVYLRYCGMTDHSIGIHSGISAMAGFVGSSFYPYFTNSLGIWTTGLYAILAQFTLVFSAAYAFIWVNNSTGMYIFIWCIIFSRVGLWIFDLSVNQLVQEKVPEHIRGRVNGVWRSFYAFFDASSFVCTIMFGDPTQFFILAMISVTMVCMATITFVTAYCIEHFDIFTCLNSICNLGSNGRNRRNRKDEYELIETTEDNTRNKSDTKFVC